ncbi:hypothetical protein L6R49_30930 [Myxococcota bacterium]|nr:hypothetical protein [Myxococcota bacterium]
MLLFALLLACGGDVTVAWSTEVCTDWDLDDEPVINVNTTDDGDILIEREGVLSGCEDTFAPDVVGEGWTIRVFEGWEPGEAAEDCEACFTPTVRLKAPPPGEYTLQWFDESSDVLPVETVVFDTRD